LTKYAACAKEREGNAYDRGYRAFTRLRCLLRDVLHHLHSTRVEKVAQLLGDLVPGSSWVIAEEDTDNRK
jgi:hypothetical protein